MRLAALRRLDLAGLPVDRLVDLDDAVLEVDVFQGERLELARAHERVDRRCVHDAEGPIDRRA
jgi:hypothetical protein